MIENGLGIHFGDLPGLIVKNGDSLVDSSGDNSSREIFQQRFVINLRVLHLGKELRIFDRDGELTT